MEVGIMSNYVTYVLNISFIRHMFKQDLESICLEHSLRWYDCEPMYDWLITEAICDLLGGHRHFVKGHYKNDYYNIVYLDKYKLKLRDYISNQLLYLSIDLTVPRLDQHNLYPVYKLMVCGDNLFISKGVSYA
jgi:hypothetical protein